MIYLIFRKHISFLLVPLFICNLSWAQNIPVNKNENSDSLLDANLDQKQSVTESQVYQPPEESKQHLITIGSGYKLQNYMLSGSGLKSDFPLEGSFPMSLGYEGEVFKRNIKFYISRYTIDYSSSDLSPRQFEVEKIESKFLVQANNKLLDMYDASLGIYYDKKKVGSTTPQQIQSPRSQHGILIHLDNQKAQDGKTSFYHEIEAGLPIYFSESSEKTGSYQYGFTLRAGAELRYKVVVWQEWAIGLYADWKYFKYSGAGEKGTVDASESEVGITIPVNLRIRF